MKIEFQVIDNQEGLDLLLSSNRIYKDIEFDHCVFKTDVNFNGLLGFKKSFKFTKCIFSDNEVTILHSSIENLSFIKNDRFKLVIDKSTIKKLELKDNDRIIDLKIIYSIIFDSFKAQDNFIEHFIVSFSQVQEITSKRNFVNNTVFVSAFLSFRMFVRKPGQLNTQWLTMYLSDIIVYNPMILTETNIVNLVECDRIETFNTLINREPLPNSSDKINKGKIKYDTYEGLVNIFEKLDKKN